jgi:phosphatidylserine decarboxylase
MVAVTLVGLLAAVRALLGRGAAMRGAGVSAVGFGLLAQFFRHPGTNTPDNETLVISPAYGRIVHIGTEEEREFLGDRRVRISTFLSVFNPHLTRAPVGGRVVYERYHPGKYLVALHPKSSTLNEQNSIGIERSDGVRILVRQIAGLLARRIRSYAKVGSEIQAGEEIGFIKFGSRVEVFLPADAEVLVTVGQHVQAGSTVIARLPA